MLFQENWQEFQGAWKTWFNIV